MAMIINERKNTVVMTKKEAKASSIFNTPEYRDLQEIRAAYPRIKVEVKAAAKRPNEKGLTYEFMESYIAAHDDENHTKMSEFEDLTAKSAEAQILGKSAKSYSTVKKWFKEAFPEFNDFEEKRKSILKVVA